jgi:hypothetical protein
VRQPERPGEGEEGQDHQHHEEQDFEFPHDDRRIRDEGKLLEPALHIVGSAEHRGQATEHEHGRRRKEGVPARQRSEELGVHDADVAPQRRLHPLNTPVVDGGDQTAPRFQWAIPYGPRVAEIAEAKPGEGQDVEKGHVSAPIRGLQPVHVESKLRPPATSFWLRELRLETR